MEKNVLERIKQEALQQYDGGFDEFVNLYTELLIEEVSKHMETLRKSGFIPTEYTLVKHLESRSEK